jgi:outer membrane protein assembly factor BamB
MEKSAFVFLLAFLVIEASCNTRSNNRNDSISEEDDAHKIEQVSQANATSWRGPNSTGVYPETGLMKEWPEDGPEVLWQYEDLGKGHSSPAIANGKIYLTGMEGGMGYLYVLSNDGSFLNKYKIGKEWSISYPGSRSTPTVAGNLIYTYTGQGILTCIDEEKGSIVWQKNMFEDFDGENIQWGVTESLVVDGEKVYCSPGGKKNNVVALNRFTGELIWSSPAQGEKSAYCTPVIANLPERKLLVTMMASHIIGIDAQSGEFLWSHSQPNTYSVHANSPIYHDGSIFCTSGYGRGGVKLDLESNGGKVNKAWFTDELDNRIGGAVLLDGYIYGSGDKNRGWKCVNWKTGELAYSSDEYSKGVTIAADGMLYIYTERGELALVKASPKQFEVISQTKVDIGSGPHWSHPVIHNGRLILRHGNGLVAYKIK